MAWYGLSRFFSSPLLLARYEKHDTRKKEAKYATDRMETDGIAPWRAFSGKHNKQTTNSRIVDDTGRKSFLSISHSVFYRASTDGSDSSPFLYFSRCGGTVVFLINQPWEEGWHSSMEQRWVECDGMNEWNGIGKCVQ